MLDSNTVLTNQHEIAQMKPASLPTLQKYPNELQKVKQRVCPLLPEILELVLVDELEGVPVQANQGLQLLVKALGVSFEKSSIDEDFELHGLLSKSYDELVNSVHRKIEGLS